MPDIPLWFWLLIVALFFMVMPRLALSNFRRTVRTELIAYLRENFEGMEISEDGETALNLKPREGGDVRLNLLNLYKEIAGLRPHTKEARREVFHKFTAVLSQMDDLDSISIETHGDRVLPRIVGPSFLAQAEGESKMPHRPIGFTGLYTAYVFDSEHHVAYISRDHAEELGLNDIQLHELALANLRKLFKVEEIEPARGENGSMTLLQNPDGHDSARLLLLPELLKEDEVLAAILPDKNTVILAPAPEDNNWMTLHALTAAGGDEPFFDHALKITHHGIEMAPVAD